MVLRRQITGEPPLLALVLLAFGLPAVSSRLRREPLLMLAVQLAVVGLVVFVLWPLAQIFLEGFRTSYG